MLYLWIFWWGSIYIYAYIHMHTLCSTIFIAKLTGFQLVNNFPIFYGTRRFIIAFITACHLSLSWASSIQSMTPKFHFLKIHFNIILPPTPGSPKWSLSLRFPHQNPVFDSTFPHKRYIHKLSHSLFYHPNNIGWTLRSLSSTSCNYLHSLVTLSLLDPNLYIYIHMCVCVCIHMFVAILLQSSDKLYAISLRHAKSLSVATLPTGLPVGHQTVRLVHRTAGFK